MKLKVGSTVVTIGNIRSSGGSMYSVVRSNGEAYWYYKSDLLTPKKAIKKLNSLLGPLKKYSIHLQGREAAIGSDLCLLVEDEYIRGKVDKIIINGQKEIYIAIIADSDKARYSGILEHFVWSDSIQKKKDKVWDWVRMDASDEACREVREQLTEEGVKKISFGTWAKIEGTEKEG